MLQNNTEMIYMELLLISILTIGILFANSIRIYKVDIRDSKSVVLMSTMGLAVLEFAWGLLEETTTNETLLYWCIYAYHIVWVITVMSVCHMLVSEFEVKTANAKVTQLTLAVPLIITAIAVLTNGRTHALYSISDEFTAIEGPACSTLYILVYGYLVASTLIIFISYIIDVEKRSERREKLRVMIVYSLMLIAMTASQEYGIVDEYGCESICYSLSACLLISYLNTRKIEKVSLQEAGYEAGLSLATEIQTGMLPLISQILGEGKAIEAAASMNPAREVGGDFYDVYYKDEDHLVLTIADVSGKGIPAAFFMAASMNILRNAIKTEDKIEDAFYSTNDSLCTGNDLGMFVTVWTGILQISTGRMICINAGHEYPVIYRNGGDYALFKDKHGLALGAMDGMPYRSYEITLNPGDAVFVYTDGVAEANNILHEMYGTDMLVDILNQNKGLTQAELLEEVKKSVDKFAGKAQQFDDITMLGFKYTGAKG